MSSPPRAPAWATGVVTGLQAVVLSASLVIALAFVAVSSAPSIDGSIAADWSGGWDIAIRVWLLAHGAPAVVGGVTVTLLPLGITLASAAITASVARRLAVAARGTVLCAGLAYGAVVAVVAGAEGSGGAASLRAGAVGALVCATGAAAGLSRRGFRFWEGSGLPETLRRGIRLGLGTAALVAAAGAVVVVAWTVASWDEVTGMVRELDPDPGGGLALAAGEAAYVPTLAVWGVSWIAGPGFTLGEGSHYGLGEVTPGPVPDLPLLQVLPDSGGGALALLPLVIVALGVAARLAARGQALAGPSGYVAQGVGIVVVGGTWWALAAIGAGSIGGGALAHVGPSPLGVGLSVAALAGAGMFAASLAVTALRAPRSTVPTRRTSASTTVQRRPSVPPAPHRTRESNDPLRLW